MPTIARPWRGTTKQFLQLPETVRRMELTRNVVREPPAPFYNHQRVIVRLTVLLDAHVTSHDIGVFCASPLDVILDEANGVVLQPDALVITHARAHIIHERIHGAPDLVIEVLSRYSRAYDTTDKRRWYREYGVREYWLVDPRTYTVTVIRNHATRSRARTFRGDEIVRSGVLPDLCATVRMFF
jgi:Uma2 family endonuclease